jgi:hypothetical protein
MTNRRYLLTCILMLIGFSCREVYEPNVVSADRNYLVVEGVLNPGGATSIHLTRTSKLDVSGIKPELNAQLLVEGKDNSVRSLISSGNGYYSSVNLNLILNTDYRLRIRTSNGKEYLSDYVTARSTPPIDSVNWRMDGDRMRFYVNAHDPSGNTRYYRWEYDETWEIKSYYYSRFIYLVSNNTVRDRVFPAEDVSKGWKFNNSTNIFLASSARLQSDVIFEAPLTAIEQGNEKLSVRYSILVRQYALDKKGYEFYDLMKKNTEDIGGVFDVQPTEIQGNIHCVTDPKELVIGYVSASTVTENRIFISASDLPFSWRYVEYCPYYMVANQPDSFRLYFQSQYYSPYDGVYSPATGALVGYLSALPGCVDCKYRGASLTKPPYW